MTELQVTINNLKEGVIAAELMIDMLEKAKKVESHEWEHGDIFLNEYLITMIYIRGMASGQNHNGSEHVFCISGSCDCAHNPKDFLKKGKFLFNIKEKL